MTISDKLILFALFASLGVSAEVLFTALMDFIKSAPEKKDLRLKGHSYLWMFPIYGIIAFLFPVAYDFTSSWNIFTRMILYALIILLVEYILGYLIEKITGKCPWEYSSRFAVHGYIRLDYIPLWALFGLLIEIVYVFASSRLI